MKLRNLTLLVAGYLLAASVPGCSKDRSTSIAGGGNSETHFLEECTDHCPGGLSCLCGVCTKACEKATDCGALSPDAACVVTCTDAPTPLMCDIPCRTTAECTKLGPESSCLAGFCRFPGEDAGAGAAGAGGTGAATAGRGGSAGASDSGGAEADAGSAATAGNAGMTSGASGASNANGGVGAGGAAGKGGSGLGPVEVTDASSFRLAQYSAYCEMLFGCPITEGDDPDITRLELETPERCVDVLVHSPLVVTADHDLDAKLAKGEIELHAEQVAPCIEALSDCAQQTSLARDVSACRTVFRGSSLLGGPCSRPEDCADDVDCVVTTTCPGTCTQGVSTEKPLGADCDRSSECDHGPGDVECTALVEGYGRSCELVTRFPPAGVDEPCSRGGTEMRPCADDLYCEQGDDIVAGGPPRPGTCRAPWPLGATCADSFIPCANDARCIDGTCQSVGISRKAGDPCDSATFCNPADRLFCNAGMCELMGDGNEGARCRAFDLTALVACEPGLVCLNPEPDAPVDPSVGFVWSRCGKPRAPGDTCQENDDCESQHCLADGSCDATYCCASYSCQSN